ncbi:hypothetical protein [Bradyrhizobium algeriense]|uniref:hypothetical protein n=1 Tax=Bradyrhizobium algeriense TaxID=634784 RepID=UPI000D3D3734|nr:hypothetical protein [Bradyrhizobium algeriense]
MARQSKKPAGKKSPKRSTKKTATSNRPEVNLMPPKGGVAIRMYRIGHGDCFLLAFSGKEKPIFVLIDCGYKPGSPKFINDITTPDKVVADIKAVTGGHIDVAVITHEHQDHVNAITKSRFDGFTIGQTWFAWTESEDDKLAKRLRKNYGDRLKTLVAASIRLAATNPSLALKMNEHIALAVGGEQPAGSGITNAFSAAGSWTNKDAMKLFRDLSQSEVKCLYPHKEIIKLPGAESVRVFALGPPYDETALKDLDPHDGEGFPQQGRHMAASLASFGAAVNAAPGSVVAGPFSARHAVSIDKLSKELELQSWFDKNYGLKRTASDHFTPEQDEVPANADFRRIDHDWLQSAETLALAMGNDTNNASLVLAFELGKGGKVLLFAADAQRGNWASWADGSFKDGNETVEVRDLLSRTVLYKTGHHGSHNATLSGDASSATPNLSWLGRGDHSSEFTAMITAVRAWATQPTVGWDHPLKSIREALLDKCSGRVFQTDTDFTKMVPLDGTSKRPWAAFQTRSTGGALYFDYHIEPG